MSPFDLIDRVSRRAIIVGLALGMATLALIGGVGMAVSVAMVENVQGSAQAINVAGSLRMQSHRMAGLVLAGVADTDRHALDTATAQFQASLDHPSLRVIEAREPEGEFARRYRQIRGDWQRDLKPLLASQAEGAAAGSADWRRALLNHIDAYVADINRMVVQLENDTEARIGELHRLLGAALALTLLVLAAVLYAVSKRVILPLNRLVEAANAIARGDFSARAGHDGPDELGRVGLAFNFMAEELSKLYGQLERRVDEKTEQLRRSNRSLELLYHSIARLYNAPVAPETYQALLADLEQVLGLRCGMACLGAAPGQEARVLAQTCAGPAALCQGIACADCIGRNAPWQEVRADGTVVRRIPLTDGERQHGMLLIALAPGRTLEAWQEQLVEALSRHIGIAIGMARQAEQQRRLALMDERAVIARELHDSLAQALSYMKIQVALLHQALGNGARAADADVIVKDLREGLNAAYRQLRELLATFRLRMEGDFLALLDRTVAEYRQRGDMEVALDVRLDGCRLSPNQEIHVLQIVREALNNVLRHACAQRVTVSVEAGPEQALRVAIVDDGIGLADAAVTGDHYGMTIMRERARSLNGDLQVRPTASGGTCVELRFDAADPAAPLPLDEAQP